MDSSPICSTTRGRTLHRQGYTEVHGDRKWALVAPLYNCGFLGGHVGVFASFPTFMNSDTIPCAISMTATESFSIRPYVADIVRPTMDDDVTGDHTGFHTFRQMS